MQRFKLQRFFVFRRNNFRITKKKHQEVYKLCIDKIFGQKQKYNLPLNVLNEELTFKVAANNEKYCSYFQNP